MQVACHNVMKQEIALIFEPDTDASASIIMYKPCMHVYYYTSCSTLLKKGIVVIPLGVLKVRFIFHTHGVLT